MQSETLLGEQTQPAVRRQDGTAVRREREIEDHSGARAPTGWLGAGPDAQDPPCHPPAFREGWLSLLQRLDELGWRDRAWLSGKGDGVGLALGSSRMSRKQASRGTAFGPRDPREGDRGSSLCGAWGPACRGLVQLSLQDAEC